MVIVSNLLDLKRVGSLLEGSTMGIQPRWAGSTASTYTSTRYAVWYV